MHGDQIKYIWIIMSIRFISQSQCTHSPLLQNILDWGNSDPETIYHLNPDYDTDWYSTSCTVQATGHRFIESLHCLNWCSESKIQWNNLIDTKLFINSFSPSFILMNYLELVKLHRLLCPTGLGCKEDTKKRPIFFKIIKLFFSCIKKVSCI